MWITSWLIFYSICFAQEPSIRGFRYEGVPHQQMEQIEKDFAYLQSQRFSNLNQPTREFFQLQDNTEYANSLLVAWLKFRVKYLIGKDFNVWNSIRVNGHPKMFSVPGSYNDSQILMINLSTLFFLKGLNQNVIYSIDFPTWGNILITSFRAGILSIGGGFFEPLAPNVSNSSEASSIYRLSTLFHEARHSDSGLNIWGYQHVDCPDGHDMAGFRACDANNKGAYTASYLILSELMKECETCKTKEKEVLKLIALDNLHRVLTVN